MSNAFVYIILVSLSLSIMSVLRLEYNIAIVLSIMLIRWIHYVFMIIGMTYAFISKSKYDLVFLVVYATTCMSWLVFKECLLCVAEEKMKDPMYKIGDHPTKRAFLGDLVGPWKDSVAILMHVLLIVNAVMVLWRTHQKATTGLYLV